ncbi:MAG: hypothetical protein JO283_19235 [Bradyrhizobium sp.]|nr:hypothetical protein [Bradyrhizobium sp.]MBV9726543.1 hypothetical protein [Gammaproteobacteria bacterium]
MLKNKWKLQILAVTLIASIWWPHNGEARHGRPLPLARGALPLPKLQTRDGLAGSQASRWTPLANQPTFLPSGASTPMLLTDGTVLVQDTCATDWWKLTPDQYGSYANGTWTQVASLPSDYAPFSNASAVLPDGRLIIEGGEYNCSVDSVNAVWSAQGAIYDPIRDVWTPVSPPPFFNVIEIVPGVYGQTIGDASSVVLADGTFMLADCCTAQSALLDPKTLTWTAAGKDKFDTNNEEGWTLLPNGNVLTVDAYVPLYPLTTYIPDGMNSELYDPRTGSWISAGSTKVQLWDSGAACGGEKAGTFEVGPGVLRADGTVFYTGSDTCPAGTGKTAIYDSRTGHWKAGPQFPVVNGVSDLNVADGPASWEPNDKVLVQASPGYSNPPSIFFEWDGRDLTTVPGPPNAPIEGSSNGDMLLLPTGQILFTDLTDDIEIYTPTMTHEDKERARRIAPVIFEAPLVISRGHSYEVSGIKFNGVTQGAAFGDDVQAATNYPLVRVTNLTTAHVSYCRTHDPSSMAVASDEKVSTRFDVPSTLETGIGFVEVVANGLASEPRLVFVK